MTEIRSYLPQDKEKAAAVWLVGMIRSHPFVPEELWLARYRSIYREELEDADALLALADGQVEGMLVFGGEGEITALAVGPSCRHKGHAGALLDAAKSRFGRLSVRVYAENEKGVAFLQKAGFVPAEEFFDLDSGHPMLRMAWCADTV